jgi:molecular chaperone HscA
MQLMQIYEPGDTPLPHENDTTPAIGIDLGTTHSVVAFSQNSKAEVLKNTHGHAIIPSVVDYGHDRPVVGHPAREAKAKGADTVISSIKRRMHSAAERVSVAGKELTPVEISADILRELRSIAERALGREITQAVITVPAHFDDTARTATRDAARLAGLTPLRLVNEPTAAALAYGLDNASEGIYAVYDLGGGTFDISILKMEKGVFLRVAAVTRPENEGSADI